MDKIVNSNIYGLFQNVFKTWQVKKTFRDDLGNLTRRYNINNYTINDDGSISVDGDIGNLDKKTLNSLKFKEVTGRFNCSNLELESLKGCPDVVGRFDCCNNKLTSMVGGPKIVDGYYSCQDNNLITFKGFPEHIGTHFYCLGNPIYEVWKLFKDESKVELLNEMDPLRVIDGKAYVVLDIMNDFLSIIGKPEVNKIFGYINI